MRILLVLTMTAGLAPSVSNAAVIRLALTADVASTVEPGHDVMYDETFDTVGLLPFRTETVSVMSPVGESARAFGSVDATTGTLRALATSVGYNPGREAGAYAGVTLTESAIVSGAGTVTAMVAYNGSWNVMPSPGNPGESVGWIASGVLAIGSLSHGGGGSLDFFHYDNGNSENTGSVNEIFSLSKSVVDGERITFNSSLVTTIMGGTMGIVDFSRSAYLSLLLSDGVSLAFDDERFLSEDPHDPSVVPVPASGLLLLSGLGMIWLRQRRATADAATRS